ncbi:MAG: hypothetical protein JXR86_16410 [Spirochaetales bacterium]|nr:hypothetical protein [Spirochaetales bacterium]
MDNSTLQIRWLMQGDPSIRYQTMRDLLGYQDERTDGVRQLILSEGWGKSLLDRQEPDGTWGGGLYSPKWISTFYTLLLFYRFEAQASPALKAAGMLLLDKGFFEKDGGINYWKTWKQSETCVTGMLLSMLSFFSIKDERLQRMADYLLEQQMDDGGWNCERYRGSVHSSFHTTISVLEGLYEYSQVCSDENMKEVLGMKQREGVEFLLHHKLYKSSQTGEIVHGDMAKMSFPPRWHYDYLRALDFFQKVRHPYDKRMADALDLLKSRKTSDGFWKLEKKYSGKLHFSLEPGGKPSRWNTLRALRILKWFGE